MKAYKLKIVYVGNKLKLQVRDNGKILCNLRIHKYFSRWHWGYSYMVIADSDNSRCFWQSLSCKMQCFLKRYIEQDYIWNYGFTIYTK